MKSLLVAVIFAVSALSCVAAEPAQQKLKVLVITGGHGFEEAPFFDMFAANTNITYTHIAHREGTSDAYDRATDLYGFDAVLLYDMVQNITVAQKTRFKGLIERGIGLVVLHHAIVNYQSWPEFERIIGGTYPEPQDKRGQVTEQLGYEHDVDIPVKILARDHPVTAGIADFELNDEIYWGFRTSSDVTPLMTTSHPKSGKPLAWAKKERDSRVVYIQLGHGPFAFKHPSFRKLVSQAILWTARKG